MRNLYIAGLIFIIISNIYISFGIAAINNDTGIKISNEMIQIGDKQIQMIYNIQTPKILHYDFVLALDSSGSIGETPTQYESVIRDIPRFLSKIPTYYPDAYFNISVISWNDNIDFAFDNKSGFVAINKNEPLPFKLAPLENVNKKFSEFYSLYKTNLTKATDYSVPLRASLDILNAPENAPKDPLHSLRFIVLVTGNGEYKPADPSLLQQASDKGIGIYTVGLDIGKDTETELHMYLENISRNKISPTPSGNLMLVDTSPFETALNKTLEAALKEHFDRIMNTSVADNIEITDRVYEYYEPQSETLKVDSKKGNQIMRSQTAQSRIGYYPVGDNTSEVKIGIYELLPNSTTTVAYTLVNTFDPMKLPVTVSEGHGPLIFSTPPTKRVGPMLRYIWHATSLKKELPLDIVARIKNRLNIMSVKDTKFNERSTGGNLGFISILNSFLFAGG